MNSLLILCDAFAATAIVDAKSSYILVEDGEREWRPAILQLADIFQHDKTSNGQLILAEISSKWAI